MSLGPDITEQLNRARADLRMGVPVALLLGDAAALVIAAETLSDARLAGLRASGLLTLAITARRAGTLKARAYDGDLARIVVPADVDAGWIAGIADPSGDLAAPLRGPLTSERNGDAALHRAAINLVKSAGLLPAAVVQTGGAALALAASDGLTLIDMAKAGPVLQAVTTLHAVVSAQVPLEVSEAGRLHVFRTADGSGEHYALEIGQPARDTPVLTRLHSACFTGDLLGSLKCDCGPQLRSALATIGAEGSGVLLYLNQEGRGIGLANKLRAYALQDQGFDTVEANHRLGFEDDERDFRIGAEILRKMGFRAVRLLTNNPAKIAMLTACGISVVEHVPLKVGRTHWNSGYLDTKAAKSGHLL